MGHPHERLDFASFVGTFDGNGHIISNVKGDSAPSLFGTIDKSQNTAAFGTVKNLGGDMGGIAGVLRGTVENCFVTGTISGGGYGSAVGGLVGDNMGTITNCYANVTVTGSGRFAEAGGFAGTSSGDVTNCYAAGAVTVTGDDAVAGGFVGVNERTYGDPGLVNCYWNKTATTAGAGKTEEASGSYLAPNPPTGKTADEMRLAAFLIALNGSGSAFVADEATPVNGGFPVLSWQAGPPAVRYTVTFDSQSATTGASPATKTVTAPATTVDTLPTPPVKTGFTFGGWFTAVNGGGTEFTENTAVTGNITVYARWTEGFDVGGNITDNSDSHVGGATVTIKRGNTAMGADTTDEHGAFTISGIPNGVYQLIITSGELTVTKTITVNGVNLAVGTVKLPTGKQNSVVEVKPDTPDIVVGGLDKQFDQLATENNKGVTAADITVSTNGGEVELRITVEGKTDAATNAAESILAAGDKTLAFLDLSVIKRVTPSGGGGTETTLTELQTLLDVRIPLSAAQQDKADYSIYRYHAGKVDTITTTANADGEKLMLIDGGKTLQLWTKKFSTYAVAYSTPTPPSPPSTGGGSVTTTYAITATAGEGGTISPTSTVHVSRNGSKAFTVTPDEGYEIADVLVDGKSVGAVATYTFEEVTAKHSIEAQFRKQVKNPFADVNEGNWFYDAVQDVLQKGIMNGTAADKFSPYLNTSRGMIVTILWRLEGEPAATAA